MALILIIIKEIGFNTYGCKKEANKNYKWLYEYQGTAFRKSNKIEPRKGNNSMIDTPGYRHYGRGWREQSLK